MRHVVLGLVTSVAAASAVLADTSFSLGIELDDAMITSRTYDCGSGDDLTVHYLTSEDNILAIVPVDGDERIFVEVVSGSGARYVAGQYEWLTDSDIGMLENTIEGETVLECQAAD